MLSELKIKLRAEREELGSKIEKLNLFIQCNGDFKGLDKYESQLLVNQLFVMKQYHEILIDRAAAID